MGRLHPVFNVMKLSPAPDDPIIGRHRNPPPPPELIDREEEYVVEKILNVRATAVGQDAERNVERNAVLAGDPKGIRLLL